MTNQTTKILIIEDHYMTQDLIRLLLERHQIEADCANDGKDALALISQKNYHLIICDLGLPDFEGFELIHTGKKINPYEKTIWLGITAQISAELNQEASVAGYLALLEKPLTELTEINGMPIIEFITSYLLSLKP